MCRLFNESVVDAFFVDCIGVRGQVACACVLDAIRGSVGGGSVWPNFFKGGRKSSQDDIQLNEGALESGSSPVGPEFSINFLFESNFL